MTRRPVVGNREVSSQDVLAERDSLLETDYPVHWKKWFKKQTPHTFLDRCTTEGVCPFREVERAVETLNDTHHYVFMFNEDVVGDKLIQCLNMHTRQLTEAIK